MASPPPPKIPITGDPDADRLLEKEPLALLIGMLLDQQVPMEWAFRGPASLKQRLGGRLDATAIAAMDPDDVAAVFSQKPALHRFPGSMGKRTHALCLAIVDDYGGKAARVWTGASTAEEVLANLKGLPGYVDEKAKIFLAILGKRLDAAPPGWEAVASPFGDDQPRSVADVADEESLLAVRNWKKAMKAAKKSKQDSS
jgi:uncharacterized HhH-GPD family protein